MVFGAEHREFHAVEAGESVPRTDPQITLAALEDGLHAALRQALTLRPHVLMVLCDRGCRIERPSYRHHTKRKSQGAVPDSKPFHTTFHTYAITSHLPEIIGMPLFPNRTRSNLQIFLHGLWSLVSDF